MKIIPENILRLMRPEDRPRGNAGLLAGEAIDKHTARLEREEQRLFSQWLLAREVEGVLTYDWSRTDRKATKRPGWPDFSVFASGKKTLFLEFKLPQGRFSSDQIRQIDLLRKLGHTVEVPQSYGEALEATKRWLAKTERALPLEKPT